MARSPAKSDWKPVAIELARTKRFKGKPLSLAVYLNQRFGLALSWRQVVQVLNDAHLANRDEYVMNGTVGFEEYGD